MAEADDEDEGLLKPGEILDGRYRIEKVLGRGGIGVVYKAFDLEHQVHVAIKMLLDKWARDRKMVARFEREGRLALRARHAYIVQILAMRRRDGSGAPYIVMEYVEGIVLLDSLKEAKDRGLPVGLAILPIIKQLASVLAACHAQKIVHRDLKPANVMLVPDEDVLGGQRAKLLDFGIAKMFSDEEDGTQTSVGDQQPGTPSYMAPEQCSTLEKDADPAKMDVYSLGVMLYQGLVGRLPLYSPNRMGMMALLLHNEPDPILKHDPTLPPELAQLVHDMLAKDPAKRPTMDQVRQRLKSRTEVINVRSTVEVNAIVPAPLSEGSLAQTADQPVPMLGSTASATPSVPAKSIGERKTDPQPSELLEQSSVGRGTGQQFPSGGASQRRRRLRLAAVGLTVAACIAGGVTWRTMRAQRVLSVVAATPAAATSVNPATGVANSQAPQAGKEAAIAASSPPVVPAPKEATPALVAAPADSPAKPSKGAKCTAVEATAACITSAVSADMRKNIFAALRDADVKLCPGDRLTIMGVEATLKVNHAPKSVPASIQKDLVFSLRSHLHGIALPGEVEIKCKR